MVALGGDEDLIAGGMCVAARRYATPMGLRGDREKRTSGPQKPPWRGLLVCACFDYYAFAEEARRLAGAFGSYPFEEKPEPPPSSAPAVGRCSD